MNSLFLYTNYSGEIISFRDLLPARRSHGSNESEQEIVDESDQSFLKKELTENSSEIVDLLCGQRFYS